MNELIRMDGASEFPVSGRELHERLGIGTEYAWADTSAAGYNTDTLTVQALAYRNGYKYRCIITDADGVKTTSLPAALTITGV